MFDKKKKKIFNFKKENKEKKFLKTTKLIEKIIK